MLDRCTLRRIDGWAVGPGATPADLAIYVNDRLVQRVRAEADRADLPAAGLPRAAGFSHRFSPMLAPSDRVSVRLPDGADLTGSPTGPVADPPRGQVDRQYQSDLSGWAVDADGAPVPVDILVNDRWVARVGSNSRREDLAARHLPPECGFGFNFPQPLRATDRLEVRFVDGGPVPGTERRTYQERLRRLLAGIEPATMKGIEFGALDRPVIGKSHGDISYVDHATSDDLRRKYAQTPRNLLDRDRIVDVDHVWAGGPLAEILPQGAVYDYAIACHMIEHIADPIGFLHDVAAILRPGGILSLAVPDRAKTFDHRRALSRPADLIGPFLRRETRPNPAQVFDCLSRFDPVDAGPGPFAPSPDQLRIAYATAQLAVAEGAYLDVHCNVFTLDSFVEILAVLSELGINPFRLKASFGDQEGTDEFIVILEKP